MVKKKITDYIVKEIPDFAIVEPIRLKKLFKDCLCVNKKTGKLEILKNVFIINSNHYFLISEINEK